VKRLLILVLAALLLLPLTVAFAQDHREGDPFWNPTEEQFAAWNVIDGVEDGATITFWTMSLSPTFDEYIQKIVENFQMTYPGVTVVWEDQP
jgi:ABC-type glycerol-3-phosphate transport system substrate-binding protein